MKRLIKSEAFVFIFLSLVFLAAAFLPTIYSLFNTPSDRVFLGVHNYYADYNIYLSEIKQGENGSIPITHKFTSEPQSKIFLRPILPIAGFVAHFINIPTQTTYHLLRILASLFLFYASYLFLSFFLKSKNQRLFAFFLAFASASFPKIFFRQNIEVYTFFNWWTGIELPARISFTPHHTLNNALFLFILFLLLKGIQQQKIHLFFFSGLLSLFLSLSAPQYTVLITLFLFFSWLFIYFAKSTKFKIINIRLPTINNLIIFNLTFLIPALIGFFYVFFTFQTHPWNEFAQWVKNQTYDVHPIELIFSQGLVAILAIFGLLIALRRRKKEFTPLFLILLIYFTSFLFLIKFPQFMNPIRLAEAPISVFFAILATYFVTIIKRKFSPLSFITISILTLIISLPAYKINFIDPLAKIKFTAYNSFPTINLYKGLTYLKNNTLPDQIVLSMTTLGNMIPAYSGNTVFLGHSISTLNYNQKLELAKTFYQGKMSPTRAKQFLINQKIDYIIVSYEENSLGNPADHYPFLKSVFTNSDITIFKPRELHY